MQVLIVDSSYQIIQRLEELIVEANPTATIYSAISHQQALLVCNEIKPDILVLCASLPENKSIQLLKDIQMADQKPAVIVLSINMNEYIQEQCRVLAVDYLLDKYHDFEKIAALISDAGKERKPKNQNDQKNQICG